MKKNSLIWRRLDNSEKYFHYQQAKDIVQFLDCQFC